jgi:hypothetical protein
MLYLCISDDIRFLLILTTARYPAITSRSNNYGKRLVRIDESNSMSDSIETHFSSCQVKSRLLQINNARMVKTNSIRNCFCVVLYCSVLF